MKHRKLRITWSLVWGLATVLLIVLCVRSFWYADVVNCFFPTDCYVGGTSNRGFIEVGEYRNVSSLRLRFELRSFDLSKEVLLSLPFYYFRFAENAGGYELWVPTWFAILLAAMCGVSVWLPWSQQFSPHAPTRHDTDCRWAGADRVADALRI
jgi:hypothetical protein